MKTPQPPTVTYNGQQFIVDVKNDRLIDTKNSRKTLRFVDIYDQLTEEAKSVIYREELQISKETADMVLSLS